MLFPRCIGIAYHEYAPYGNPTDDAPHTTQYGFTGEWWQADIGLLHLRARWYDPGSGTFLSVDLVESEPPYQYVRGNVVNRVDPSGMYPSCDNPRKCKLELMSTQIQALGGMLSMYRHVAIVFHDSDENIATLEGMPSGNPIIGDPGTLMAWGPHEGVQDIIGGIRNQGTYGAKFVRILDDKQACKAWECLKGKINIIDSMEVPYRISGPNSNTAVYTALKACNIPLFWSWNSEDWAAEHLGWGLDLFSQPMPRPAPTPLDQGTPIPPKPILTPPPKGTQTPNM